MLEKKEIVNMSDIYTAEKFLKDAGTYYLATLDKDGQPRVRPFGTAHVFEGKLYIQTGLKKDVAKQMLEPGAKVEICAMNKDSWIRISAEPVHDPRSEAQASMLEAYPSLKSMYAVDDGNTAVFWLKNAKAAIASFTAEPDTFTF